VSVRGPFAEQLSPPAKTLSAVMPETIDSAIRLSAFFTRQKELVLPAMIRSVHIAVLGDNGGRVPGLWWRRLVLATDQYAMEGLYLQV
jgi:hypothetical protein